MSASAKNYVYYVKTTSKSHVETKPAITREEVNRVKHEVSK